jgi:sulfate adenylyltransferase
MGALKDPHGGTLKNLYLDEAGAAEEKVRARDLPSWDLNMRQLCDIELLLNGAFSPLEGFLGEADYERVLAEMRLASGVLWPMPITLDVTDEFAAKVAVGDEIALRDGEGVLTATMKISSIYRPDFDFEARAVYGTTDQQHPAVGYSRRSATPSISAVRCAGSKRLCTTISNTCATLLKNCAIFFVSLAGAASAFQTRNPMHRAHQELTFRAAEGR